MINRLSLRRLASATAAVAVLAGAGAGYSALHATASATPTAGPVARAPIASTSIAATPAMVSGAWVYRDPLTVETLQLKADRKGIVTGAGTSTKKSATDPSKLGDFSISVHDGRLRNNALTFSLYVQEQFGNYSTLVEYLRCTPTARVLHCKTQVQIAYKVYNSVQDFYRH